jgi:hypothetical protein
MVGNITLIKSSLLSLLKQILICYRRFPIPDALKIKRNKHSFGINTVNAPSVIFFLCTINVRHN